MIQRSRADSARAFCEDSKRRLERLESFALDVVWKRWTLGGQAYTRSGVGGRARSMTYSEKHSIDILDAKVEHWGVNIRRKSY